MKFSTTSTALYEALDTVSGALPSKSDKEILECILLQRKGDHLEIRATDLEVSIRHRFSVGFSSEPDEDLDIVAVPAKQLLESCRTLPEIPITFEVGQNYKIILSHDRGQYDWMGFSGYSFPEFPVISEAQSVEFDRGQLKTGFNLVSFAVSKDMSRPGMMGVLFEILEGSARIVGTDGHRLARCIFKDYEGELDVSALAPFKAFQQVARVDGLDECTIEVSENFLAFTFGHTHVVSSLINASFPNYERAIPTENDKIVLLNRDDLLNSVRRVNFFASENSHQILLDCKEDSVEVSAWDVERSSKGSETISCEYRGEATQVGFNAEYLLDLLRSLPAGDVSLAMGMPNRAALMRPIPQSDLQDLTLLIMPVMLNTGENF